MVDYEALQPRLDALLKAHREDLELAASLEKRVARLMEGHATQVCSVFPLCPFPTDHKSSRSMPCLNYLLLGTIR